jgi:hypothetical protein
MSTRSARISLAIALLMLSSARWRRTRTAKALERVRSGSPLSCREVYVAEPDEVGDGETICDIAFPLTD